MLKKKIVNGLLYGELSDLVVQDENFHWYPVGEEINRQPTSVEMRPSPPEIDVSNSAIYPDGFLRWLANREGSVRRPFVDGTGRPLDDIIETDLTGRLTELAASITNGSGELPMIIMLAGGAGNGKSEALELFLGKLALHGFETENVLELMKSKFATRERAIDLDSDDFAGLSTLAVPRIRVVQDASEGDDSDNRAGSLLVQDIKGAINQEWILVCCVNRGILESARYEAASSSQYEEISSILNSCVQSLDRSSRAVPCWPLGIDLPTYVWPMDIESLAKGDPSPVQEVLRRSTIDGAWSGNVREMRDTCPIELNRKRLSKEEIQSTFASLVHYHEVATGTRWSFRNIFSLIGFVMSGGSTRRSDETPSQLSERLNVSDQGLSLSELAKVRLDRLRATFQQQLFPLLPQPSWFASCATNDFGGSDLLVALAKYLESQSGYTPRYSIEQVMRGDWSDWLDPARERFGRIDSEFSQSIERGLETNRHQFSRIEVDALEWLAECEADLVRLLNSSGYRREDKYQRGKQLIWYLRRLASMFAKRSIGITNGIASRGGRVAEIRDFLARCESDRALRGESQLIERLFATGSSDQYSYVVRADHVIGQPSMESVARVQVDGPDTRVSPLPDVPFVRPNTDYREFEVKPDSRDDRTIIRVPYNFPLYQRLRAMENNLLDGSLDPMLRGALDQAKISLDGYAIRGWSQQRVQIMVGNENTESKTIIVRPDGSIRLRSSESRP